MDGVIPLIIVSAGIICASFTDITRFKVYNSLTFPLFFGGITWGVVTNGLTGLGFALAGGFLGLGVLLIPYLMGGLGAGDVKFVMAMGTWVGAALLLPAILIGCLALFVYYGIAMTRQAGVSGVTYNLQLMLFRLSCFGRNLVADDQFETVQSIAHSKDSPSRGRLIPFSAMMSIGILVAVLVVKWVQSS